MFENLRDFLSALREQGELHDVEVEVDPHLEVGAICRLNLDEAGPALLLQKVKDYPFPVLANMMGTMRRAAISLETTERDLLRTYIEKTSRGLIKPVLVPDGPCKEVRIGPEDLDLRKIAPQIWSNPDDGGVYINYGVTVSKDPDTGIQNVGIYRYQMRAGNRTGVYTMQPQHMGVIFSKYEERNQPMEIAVVIGADPSLYIASQVRSLDLDVDEIALASAMRGKAIELVKCETVDLEVPAQSEMVLEGVVLPGLREPEGPYGEYPGYYGPVTQFPVVEFRCVTHRRDPIYTYMYLGGPPTDAHVLMSLGMESGFFDTLKAEVAPRVRDVYCPPDGFTAIVSMKKEFEENAKHVIYRLLDDRNIKTIVVVDDDIDPRNLDRVSWAIANRCHAPRDVIMVEGFGGIGPSNMKYGAQSIYKLGIDATQPLSGYPKLVRPSEEHLNRVKERWGEIMGREKD